MPLRSGPTYSPTSSWDRMTRLGYGREMLVLSSCSLARSASARAFTSRACAFAMKGFRRVQSEISAPGVAFAKALAASSPRAVSIRTRASAAFTAISAACTRSSYSAGSILTNVSFASIEPPLLNFGETQVTRPSTSDLTRALSERPTAPVSSTVSDCPVRSGCMTLTTGLVSSGDSAEAVSRSIRSGARAKYRATAMTARIRTI